MENNTNSVTCDNIEALLSSYISSPIINQLNDYYGEKSFLEILHVDRKEIYHSNFLKWLFEDEDTYKLAVQNLLILLLKRARQQNSHFPEWLRIALLTNSFHLGHVEVKLEDSVSVDTTKGRGDILITATYTLGNIEPKALYIFIENKVKSTEHSAGKSSESQTSIYYKYYSNLYKEANIVFVYLTPISPAILREMTEPQCACKSYIHINYQDLLDNILMKLSDHTSIQLKKQFYIKEYIKGLSTNFSQNNSIMAIEPKLRDLLIDFWDNNHKLIELSIDALTQDPDLDVDEKQTLEVVNKSIKELAKKRDTTRYSIDEQGKYGKCAMVYEIVRKYLEIKNYNVSLQELQKVFPYSWRGKSESLSNMVVIGKERFENEVNAGSKWRWKRIDTPLSDGEYVYVINQWGNADHMREVIKKINKIPELEDVSIKEIIK